MTDHQAKLEAAARRVAAMDAHDGHEERSLVVLVAALSAGLSGNDDSGAYDALIMLIDIQRSITVPFLNTLSLKEMLLRIQASVSKFHPNAESN